MAGRKSVAEILAEKEKVERKLEKLTREAEARAGEVEQSKKDVAVAALLKHFVVPNQRETFKKIEGMTDLLIKSFTDKEAELKKIISKNVVKGADRKLFCLKPLTRNPATKKNQGTENQPPAHDEN